MLKKISLLALMAGGLLLGAQSGRAQAFIGLQTGGTGLSRYTAPGAAPTTYTIGGTTGGEALVGIDYFLSNGGALYGIAASGNLYSLAQTSTTAYTATLSNTLAGTAGINNNVTAIDFNPMANRLRVYAGTGNFRISTGTGGLISADGTLAYNTGDVNVGKTPALGAAAYINSFTGSNATALYSLDTTLDALILNTGAPQFSGLTTVATLTLGGLTFDVTPGNTGFDIIDPTGSPALAANTAYVTKGSALYTLNLTTGVLTAVGTQTGTALIDVAFVPEPGTYAMMALGGVGFAVFAVRRRRQMMA